MLSEFMDFLTNLQQYGLEYFRRYYGPYKARVVDNADPQALGRVQVECQRARLTGFNGVWVLPMMSGAGENAGVFWPPEEGEIVWLFFDNGDFHEPLCYMGGWFGPDEVPDYMKPEEGKPPTKRGLMTLGGHRLVFEDKEGEESITIEHKNGQIFQITPDGKVKVGDKNGSFEPMMRGSTVKAYLESHTHTHSWGPTGPSIQPFPSSGLSKDTETS